MKRIAGIDEVGRGPLAGPVVAAAVILPQGYENPDIKDSKKLSAKKRDALYEVICQAAEQWAIAVVGPHIIDRINIREATKSAMSAALASLEADLALIDGNMPINTEIEQKTVIKGDAKHIEIAAASILAKVWRDKHMAELSDEFPGYGLEKHAGYPTKAHKEAIASLGPSPIHRRSFRGVREHANAPLKAPDHLPYMQCHAYLVPHEPAQSKACST